MQTEICAQKLVGHRNEKQNHRNVSAERSSLSSFKHILHAAQGQPHYWKETRWTDLISHSCSYSKCGVSLETEIERSQLNALGYFCRRAVYSSIFTTFGGYSSIGGVAHVHRPDTSLWRHPGWAPQRTTLITYGCRLRESLSKERQRRFSACQQQKKKKKKPRELDEASGKLLQPHSFCCLLPGMSHHRLPRQRLLSSSTADQCWLCQGPLEAGAAQIMQQRHRNSQKRVFIFRMC